jgi:polar amino acid transport system substrate-binding protein
MKWSENKHSRLLSCGLALGSLAVLAACSSSSSQSSSAPSSTSPSGASSSSSSPGEDAALASQVPAKYKAGFTVAMQSSQPPEAYLQSGQAEGISPALVRAISTLIGVPIKIDSTTFENELLGLSAGRYGFVTDTNVTTAREKIYDQIAYYTVEYRFITLSSSPPLGDSFSALCGKTVGDQVGDVSVPVIQQFSQTDCVAKGQKAITITQLPSTSSAQLAMQSGRLDAVARPLDAAEYETTQPGGAGISVDGPRFLEGLVGASFPKGSGLTPVIASALTELVKNGTYQKIMTQYKYDSTVWVTNFTVNPTPLPGS